MAKEVKAKAEKPSAAIQEALYARIQKEIEAVQRKAGLASGVIAPAERLSTNLLMYDLMVGGGLLPGAWITSSGFEQSAKSTLVMQATIAAVAQNFPQVRLWDFEGSTGADTSYLANQMRTNGLKLGVDDLIGVHDKDGKTVKKGHIWYQPATVLEDFFEIEARILRRLPDKLFLNGAWWLCLPDDKYGREIMAGKFDKRIKQQFEKLAIPALDARGQGMIVSDSFAAMNPRALDTDENSKQGMSLKARVFAEKIPLVRGHLMNKRVILLGVNQMREKPGVMFGDPTYEPGGKALAHAADARIKMTGRAVRDGKGPYEEEKTWDGKGTDTYRYIHARAFKNKVGGPPNLESWYRIWAQDSKGRGNGFDPVYDTFEYGRTTGQIKGTRKKIEFVGPLAVSKKAIGWQEFKALVLAPPEEVGRVLAWAGIIKKGEKPFRIRERFRKQLKEGDGFERYFATRQAKKEEDEED